MSANIERLNGNILKHIFLFLSFEEFYANIGRTNKRMNKYCRELKDRCQKIKAFYMPLFSKNIEFPCLSKLEITFSKYCKPKPIKINSQALKKIKLKFETQSNVMRNIENYISIDVLDKVKSIKIFIEPSNVTNQDFDWWINSLSKELSMKIKIYAYENQLNKDKLDHFWKDEFTMKIKKVHFSSYIWRRFTPEIFFNIVDLSISLPNPDSMYLANFRENQIRKLYIKWISPFFLENLREFLNKQRMSLKKLTLAGNNEYNKEDLKIIDKIIDDMRSFPKFKRFNGFYLKNDKKNREKTDIVILQKNRVWSDKLLIHILTTLIKKYNRKFDLIYYGKGNDFIKENIKDYNNNQAIMTLVQKPDLINNMISFFLTSNGSFESFNKSIESKLFQLINNKLCLTETVFNENFDGEICEEYLIRVLISKFRSITIRNAIIHDFSFTTFNLDLRKLDISNIAFLGSSFDSFILWISKIKQLSELIITNCTNISYNQFYNLLLNIANHSNIDTLILDIPTQSNDRLSLELIELVKQILIKNYLCLRTIYINLPIRDYQRHLNNLEIFFVEEICIFKMGDVFRFEFTSLGEFYVKPNSINYFNT